MRCKDCKALDYYGYEYPEWYCSAMVPEEKQETFDDGEVGCRFSAKAIKLRMKKYDELPMQTV